MTSIKEFIEEYTPVIGAYNQALKDNKGLIGTVRAGSVIPEEIQKAKLDIETRMCKARLTTQERGMIYTQALLNGKGVKFHTSAKGKAGKNNAA